MSDAFGTEINVDDTVAYAVRQGANMWLKRLRVTELLQDGKVRGFDPDDVRLRFKVISNLSTCVVLGQLD